MPSEIEQYLTKARQLTETGNLEEARLHLLELLQEEPDNQAALMMLGGSYFSSNQLAEAEMVFERLILLSPGTGEYSIALFNTLWKLDRHEEAFEEIKRFMSHAEQVEERETIEQYIKITKKLSGSDSS